jgi:hypothetical protein
MIKAITNHPFLTVATILTGGLALVGYLGYRLVRHIIDKCGTEAKVDEASKKGFDDLNKDEIPEELDKDVQPLPEADLSPETLNKIASSAEAVFERGHKARHLNIELPKHSEETKRLINVYNELSNLRDKNEIEQESYWKVQDTLVGILISELKAKNWVNSYDLLSLFGFLNPKSEDLKLENLPADLPLALSIKIACFHSNRDKFKIIFKSIIETKDVFACVTALDNYYYGLDKEDIAKAEEDMFNLLLNAKDIHALRRFFAKVHKPSAKIMESKQHYYRLLFKESDFNISMLKDIDNLDVRDSLLTEYMKSRTIESYIKEVDDILSMLSNKKMKSDLWLKVLDYYINADRSYSIRDLLKMKIVPFSEFKQKLDDYLLKQPEYIRDPIIKVLKTL